MATLGPHPAVCPCCLIPLLLREARYTPVELNKKLMSAIYANMYEHFTACGTLMAPQAKALAAEAGQRATGLTSGR